MRFVTRTAAPMLAGIERGTGNVRWEKAHVVAAPSGGVKEPLIRTALRPAMAVGSDKAAVDRTSVSPLRPSIDAYDSTMKSVVENMFERDGASPAAALGIDTFEVLRNKHTWELNTIARLRAQLVGFQPNAADEQEDAEEKAENAKRLEAEIERHVTAERELTEDMLGFYDGRTAIENAKRQAANEALRKQAGSTASAAAAEVVDDESTDTVAPFKQHNYAHVLQRVHLCYEKAQAKFLQSLRQPSFIDQIVNPVESSKSRLTGRERLNTIRTVLDSFGLERSEMQKAFHEDMIAACAKLIFKDDLLSELDDLLVELGLDELQQQFMAITARRTGKTYSVGMFVVAMLFGCEGVEQAIFSTGRRASQKLIELVYRLLCKIPGMRESIVKHNVETIWIKGPYGDDDVRKVFSYPSNVRISDSSFPFARARVLLFFFFPLSIGWILGVDGQLDPGRARRRRLGQKPMRFTRYVDIERYHLIAQVF